MWHPNTAHWWLLAVWAAVVGLACLVVADIVGRLTALIVGGILILGVWRATHK